jgi:hypothetical protein
VTGHIRLIPDADASASLPLPFSIPAQGSQAFPSVLSGFGSVSSPAILAVESSDAVRLSGPVLRIGYPERPLTFPVRFNPGTPTIGALVLGILNGLVRVNFFEHQTSSTPLGSRTFGASGEQIARLRYIDLLPANMAISDGYVEVLPLSGQIVGTAENPPTRRHAAGRPSTSPPIVSIAGDPACEFATGIHASVAPITDATYRWSLVNATVQGPLTSNTLDLALGNQGYASLLLEAVFNGSATTVETNIAIGGKPAYARSTATSVTLGQDVTIGWTLTGSAPTSQTLSGTDFAALTLDGSVTSYTYRPTTVGPKSYSLSGSNSCGDSGSSGTYSVAAPCTVPNASVTVPASVPPNTTFTASMPAGAETYEWQVTGNGSIVSGATSAVVTIEAGASGTLSVTGTAKNGTCMATDTKIVAVSPPLPVISNVSVMPSAIPFGGLAAIEFTTTNTTSWEVSSGIGNGFAVDPGRFGSGDGDFFVLYGACCNDGQETVKVTATGPGGQTTQTVSFLISDSAPNTPPTISSVVATNTPSGLTLTYTLSGANFWGTDPRCSPGSGRGSGTFTAPCTATRFSEQYYQVIAIGSSGYADTAVLTVYITAPSSTAASTSFTASMGANHSAYNWSVTNGTILSGQGTQTATIRAGTAGTPLTIQGTASSGTCCTATDTVSVSITQPPVKITSFSANPTTINFGEGSTLTFTITDGATWTLSSSIGNTFSQSSGTGSGTFTVTYGAGNDTGTDTVTLHANGTSSSDTGTVSIKVN